MTTPPPSGYATEEPTHAPPWHGLVVWDVFFNALTTGLFIVTAVAWLTKPAAFGPVARWAYPLAMALLLLDLLLLVLDLGDPLRFHHMLRVFKPSSPMSLGTWCLTLYSLPLGMLAAFELLLRLSTIPTNWVGLDQPRVVLVVLGLPFAFGSMAYKGVLFSTSSQPGWRDARWLGAYHVVSSFALGAATLLALAAVGEHERAAQLLAPALGGLLVAQLVPLGLLAFELRRSLAERYSRGERVRASVLALGVGVLLPLALLPVGEPVAQTAAAAGALVGGWVVRRFIVLLPHAHEMEVRPRSG